MQFIDSIEVSLSTFLKNYHKLDLLIISTKKTRSQYRLANTCLTLTIKSLDLTSCTLF